MTMYLVSQIAINSDRTFEVDLPASVIDYGQLSEPYIRSHMFLCEDITFSWRMLNSADCYTTSNETLQSFYPDLVERNADNEGHDDVTVTVHPLHAESYVVHIDTKDLIEAGESLEQAIFEQLLRYYKVDFLITQNV